MAILRMRDGSTVEFAASEAAAVLGAVTRQTVSEQQCLESAVVGRMFGLSAGSELLDCTREELARRMGVTEAAFQREAVRFRRHQRDARNS